MCSIKIVLAEDHLRLESLTKFTDGVSEHVSGLYLLRLHYNKDTTYVQDSMQPVVRHGETYRLISA